MLGMMYDNDICYWVEIGLYVRNGHVFLLLWVLIPFIFGMFDFCQWVEGHKSQSIAFHHAYLCRSDMIMMIGIYNDHSKILETEVP